MPKAFIFGVGGGGGAVKPEQTKTVDLSMASGDQEVSPDAGKVLTRVTVTKPATLIPNNIKNGIDIGGVAGDFGGEVKPEQTKTVDLSMASGNQIIAPDTGKVLTQVTVNKPATLTADNIRKDITIGGVTGTYAGGGATLPTLRTVSISRSGHTLKISNPQHER